MSAKYSIEIVTQHVGIVKNNIDLFSNISEKQYPIFFQNLVLTLETKYKIYLIAITNFKSIRTLV